MPIDIVIHCKGLFTLNEFTYKNIRNHKIQYTDNFVLIEFNYTPKSGFRKGKDVLYQNSFPINSLYRIGVRTYE